MGEVLRRSVRAVRRNDSCSRMARRGFLPLGEGSSPRTICDPWAGAGFLLEAIREECRPEQAFAFTQFPAIHELGKVLVPRVEWKLGDPLLLLEKQNEELDVVASILPMGARSANPLKVATISGETVELRDDLGNLVLVAASLHLSSSGVGLFVVTPSFFFSQRSVLRQFTLLGLGVEAALALPSGTFAPYTNISAYLLIVRRKPVEEDVRCTVIRRRENESSNSRQPSRRPRGRNA